MKSGNLVEICVWPHLEVKGLKKNTYFVKLRILLTKRFHLNGHSIGKAFPYGLRE